MKHLFAKIEYLAKVRNISHQELLNILGIGNTTYYEWKKNPKKVNLGAINNLSEVFGIRGCDLLDDNLILGA